MYTIRQLIDSNREVLAARKLGAILHRVCNYDYGDGCRCAVGAVLNESDLTNIRWKYNERAVGGLVRDKIIEVENLDVFSATQDLHDAWARRVRYFVSTKLLPGENFPQELYDFLFRLQNQQVLESNYVQWLDLLDKHFPQTPVEAA